MPVFLKEIEDEEKGIEFKLDEELSQKKKINEKYWTD